ncbi:MAG: hypothetical protein QXT45_00130 [Candidatus Bilamarchaeaceae archaeon]
MTKKSLLVPYKKASDYPLVETIKKTLTENECRYVEILDVENERHFAKEIKRLVILSFKKHGKIMNLTPPQQDSIRINLIFRKQFESDLEYSMGAVQKLNIVSEKKQTIFEIEKGQYITREFINAALPRVFTGIDTFVLGGNVIGAWPTKAIKLTNSEGKPLNHYNIFIHPILILDKEKTGIWRKAIDINDLLNKVALDETNRPLFFNVLALYYTTKTKDKKIKVTDDDLKEVMKICNKITNISSWINKTFPYYFITPFTEGSRKLDLNNIALYDFNRVKEIVLATSRTIDAFKKNMSTLYKLSESITEFASVCALLDYMVLPWKTKLYITGSELIYPSARKTIATDVDMILIPGIKNDTNLFIKPTGEKKIDLKIFTKEDFTYGFNMKFVSMLLDSNLEDLVKEHLRKKIGALAPELSRAYLIEGLFEAYLFEKILQEEIKCVAEEMVLPTDLVKKSLGLQRTIDYLRWHLITAHGKDLFNENEIFSLYKFFLEQRRRLTKKMRKAEFFEILGKRSTVLERLHELSKNFNTAEIRSYLLLLSKTMGSDSNPSEKDFAVFCKTINSDLQLSELDEMSTKILGIKFSEDIAQSIRMFLELKCSKHPKTQFLEKEAIKALLQRLRLHSLFAKNDEIYETLPAEVVEYLYDIDPVYAAAALKKILSESIKDNLLVFYWNNLTHISDLYKKGLPCK